MAARNDPSGRLAPFLRNWFDDSDRYGSVFDDAFGDSSDYDDYDWDWGNNNDFEDYLRNVGRGMMGMIGPFRSRPSWYDAGPAAGNYPCYGRRRMRRRERGGEWDPSSRWALGPDRARGEGARGRGELDWGGRPQGGGRSEDQQQRQLAAVQRPADEGGQGGGRGGVSRIRNTRDKYQISIDVHHFKPDEITVRTTDNWINIEANHEERGDEHGYVKRHFRRRYLLPDNVKPERVSSKLSPDGILTIIAPKESYGAMEGQERDVPVQYEKRKGAIEGGSKEAQGPSGQSGTEQVEGQGGSLGEQA